MSILPGKFLYNKHDNSGSNLGNDSTLKDGRRFGFKVILVGEAEVGKTCIFNRYTKDEFDSTYKCTIGSEYMLKTYQFEEKYTVQLNIWDTCGSEKYRAITKQYYSGVHAALLVFDITNAKSFKKLNEWIDDINNCCLKNCLIVVVANKKDLEGRREVSRDVIKRFLAQHKGLAFFETSARTAEGVKEMFEKVVEVLFKKDRNGEFEVPAEQQDVLNRSDYSNQDNRRKEGCC